jgi:hypothetical protein
MSAGRFDSLDVKIEFIPPQRHEVLISYLNTLDKKSLILERDKAQDSVQASAMKGHKYLVHIDQGLNREVDGRERSNDIDVDINVEKRNIINAVFANKFDEEMPPYKDSLKRSGEPGVRPPYMTDTPYAVSLIKGQGALRGRASSPGPERAGGAGAPLVVNVETAPSFVPPPLLIGDPAAVEAEPFIRPHEGPVQRRAPRPGNFEEIPSSAAATSTTRGVCPPGGCSIVGGRRKTKGHKKRKRQSKKNHRKNVTR